MTTYILEMNVC